MFFSLLQFQPVKIKSNLLSFRHKSGCVHLLVRWFPPPDIKRKTLGPDIVWGSKYIPDRRPLVWDMDSFPYPAFSPLAISSLRRSYWLSTCVMWSCKIFSDLGIVNKIGRNSWTSISGFQDAFHMHVKWYKTRADLSIQPCSCPGYPDEGFSIWSKAAGVNPWSASHVAGSGGQLGGGPGYGQRANEIV